MNDHSQDFANIRNHLLDRFKMIAAARNIRLSDLLEEALEEYLERHDRLKSGNTEDMGREDINIILPLSPHENGAHDLIRNALNAFMEDSSALPHAEEKRKSRRIKTNVPAKVYENSADQSLDLYHPATILDISVGGAKIRFPLSVRSRVEFISKGSDFEMVCSLGEKEEPLRLKCRLTRVIRDMQTIQIGAVFDQLDNTSYARLQDFCRK